MIRLIIPEILGDFPRTLRAQEILEDGFRCHFHGYHIIKQPSCSMPPRNLLALATILGHLWTA